MSKPYTRVSYVLIILTLFFLISSMAFTLFFYVQPEARSAFTVDFQIIVAWVALISVLFIVSLIGIFKRQRWGAVIAGVTAMLDVIAGFVVFAEVSAQIAYLSELAVTFFAFLEYRRLSKT